MSMYSKDTYTMMLDQMLSQELCYTSAFATETNIKNAMKRVLGALIKQNILKRYYNLVLDEDLNVHISIVDSDDSEFDIVLFYGA
jgi:hypothetical protein